MAPREQRPDCAAAVDHHKDKNNSSPSTTQQRPGIPTARRQTTVDSPHRSDPRQAQPSPSGSVPNYLKPTQSFARQTSVSAPDGYKDKKPPPILKPPAANTRKFVPPPPEQSMPAVASPTSKTSLKGLAPPALSKPAVASPTSKTSPKGLAPPAQSEPTGGATTSPKHPLLPAHSKLLCGPTTLPKHPLPPAHSKPARSGTTSPATMTSPKRILPPSKPRDGASLWRKIKQSKLVAGAGKTAGGEPKKPRARTRSVSMGAVELQPKAMLPRQGGGTKVGAKKGEEAREEQPQLLPADGPARKNNVKALVGAFENVISLRDETTLKDAGEGRRVGHHDAVESDQHGQHVE